MLLRNVGVLGLCASLVAGCDDGDDGDTGASDGSTTAAATTSGTDPSAGAGEESGTTGASASDSDASTSNGGADTSGGAETSDDTTGAAETGSGSESGTTGEVVYDEEFLWVADFLRDNCVQCHANDANGNLILPTAEIGNDEVRLALEGVQANTGLLLVEPFDRNASQTYLQITNEFGAQFPVDQTDRFGDWIDAGAPYLAE